MLYYRERKKDSYNRTKLDVNEKISRQEVERDASSAYKRYVEDHELFAMYLQIICTANAKFISKIAVTLQRNSESTLKWHAKRNMTEIHHDVFTPQRHEELCRTECGMQIDAGASTSWGDDRFLSSISLCF